MTCCAGKIRFDGTGAIVVALMRADAIFSGEGHECWVTSVNDSTHMQGSKHYDGRAVDLRVHHLPDESTRARIAWQMRVALGPQFTVLYEGAGTANAHIHCQFNGD